MTGAGIRGCLLGLVLGVAPADLLAVGGGVVNVPALCLTTRGLLAVKSPEHVPALL